MQANSKKQFRRYGTLKVTHSATKPEDGGTSQNGLQLAYSNEYQEVFTSAASLQFVYVTDSSVVRWAVR